MLHGLQSGCKERFPRIMVSSYFPRGSTMTRKGESSLPFLLSRIGLAISVPVLPISDAVHCNRPRSALQPPLQCTASAWTYLVYFKRKYMRPPRITFATADANVCGKSLHLASVFASTCNRPRRYLREKHHLGKVSGPNPFRARHPQRNR